MAKPNHERVPDDKKGPPPEAVEWETWEELLLAYAVNRFGNNWDSISSALRKRSSASIVFTPKYCKQKFQELECRFAESESNDVQIEDATTAVPWIEELRKLRVAELQRELENYDICISSLQSKVKKLTEESDKRCCGESKEKSDLGQIFDEIEIKNVDEGNNKQPDLAMSSQKQVPGVDESDRDSQSMNGSNGNLETGADRTGNESSPMRSVDGKQGSSPYSRIGLNDSTDRRPEPKDLEKNEPGWESSQDLGLKKKERVKGRSDRVRRGNSITNENETADELQNSVPVRSVPLIDYLQKVHKLGSAIFERRLDRQEKLRYKNLIREHIDLEILQTRLKEGWYSDGNNEFFRDLLLLVNNTCIFFSMESPESVAAIKLRQFILQEMTSNKKQQITNSKSLVILSPSKPATLPPKQAPESADKPELVAPMTACRRRSSISAKASEDSFGRKEQELINSTNEKETVKSRFGSISKRSGKDVCGCDDILGARSDQEQEKTSASENSEVKSDMKKTNGKRPIELEEKKQSVAKFLNRMKETSNNKVVVMADGDGDQPPKRGSGGRQLKDPDSPTKRSISRPPKKAAAQPTSAALGKWNRERTESESSVSKQAKKRWKRL